MRLDLHVHTTASPDGMNTPRGVVRAALRRGLSGVAITDHNTNAAVAAVRAAAPVGFIVIAGVEYSTDCGHVLALFCEDFAEGIPRDGRGRFLLEALRPFVVERGGLLVAAHPLQGRETLPETLLAQVDGLESVNAREWSRNPHSRERVEAIAHARGLFVTGGGDAHLPMEIGRAYTTWPDMQSGVALTEQALRDALAGGMCSAGGKPGIPVYRVISRIWKKLR